jgi:hypothetical protein
MQPQTRKILAEQAYLIFPIVSAFLIGRFLPSATAQWQVALAFLVLLIFILVLPFLKLVAERALQLDQGVLETKLQESSEKVKTIAIQKRVLNEMVDSLSDLLRDCVRELKKTNDALEGSHLTKNIKQLQNIGANASTFAETLSKRTLDKIRDMLNYPEDPTEDERDARVTLFKMITEEEGHRVLQRYVYSYPPGLSPRTEQWNEEEHKDSALFRCVLTERMFVVPDVPQSAREWQRGVPGWIDRRTNHHLEYGSMVCYPVITGKPNSPERRFVGVLTVTVKQTGFFKGEMNSSLFPEQFISKVLHPYAILIGILSEIERSAQIGQSAFGNLLAQISQTLQDRTRGKGD